MIHMKFWFIGLVALVCFGAPVRAQDVTIPQTIDELNLQLQTIADISQPNERRAALDALWDELVYAQKVPFIEGTQVVFLYRGIASAVAWIGDFNWWEPSSGAIMGRRVGHTDLWMAVQEFPPDGRVDYRILINGSVQIVDPVNPYQTVSGLGTHSELRMPDYVFPPDSIRREDVPRGTVSGSTLIESHTLGYTLNYWVYTPVGYDHLDNLPTIYVTDGNDFKDDGMGSMVIVLDNLIAEGRIQPVIAVFIDAWEPGKENNRRVQEFLDNFSYARFVAEELVPAVDAQYRTNPSADARAIMGISAGGVAAPYIAGLYPHIFHMVSTGSPYWRGSKKLIPLYQQSATMPLRFFIGTGKAEWDQGDMRPILDELERMGYLYQFVEVPGQGHNWGNWRSLLDEMLIYFFGTASQP